MPELEEVEIWEDTESPLSRFGRRILCGGRCTWWSSRRCTVHCWKALWESAIEGAALATSQVFTTTIRSQPSTFSVLASLTNLYQSSFCALASQASEKNSAGALDYNTLLPEDRCHTFVQFVWRQKSAYARFYNSARLQKLTWFLCSRAEDWRKRNKIRYFKILWISLKILRHVVNRINFPQQFLLYINP